MPKDRAANINYLDTKGNLIETCSYEIDQFFSNNYFNKSIKSKSLQDDDLRNNIKKGKKGVDSSSALKNACEFLQIPEHQNITKQNCLSVLKKVRSFFEPPKSIDRVQVQLDKNQSRQTNTFKVNLDKICELLIKKFKEIQSIFENATESDFKTINKNVLNKKPGELWSPEIYKESIRIMMQNIFQNTKKLREENTPKFTLEEIYNNEFNTALKQFYEDNNIRSESHKLNIKQKEYILRTIKDFLINYRKKKIDKYPDSQTVGGDKSFEKGILDQSCDALINLSSTLLGAENSLRIEYILLGISEGNDSCKKEFNSLFFSDMVFTDPYISLANVDLKILHTYVKENNSILLKTARNLFKNKESQYKSLFYLRFIEGISVCKKFSLAELEKVSSLKNVEDNNILEALITFEVRKILSSYYNSVDEYGKKDTSIIEKESELRLLFRDMQSFFKEALEDYGLVPNTVQSIFIQILSSEIWKEQFDTLRIQCSYNYYQINELGNPEAAKAQVKKTAADCQLRQALDTLNDRLQTMSIMEALEALCNENEVPATLEEKVHNQDPAQTEAIVFTSGKTDAQSNPDIISPSSNQPSPKDEAPSQSQLGSSDAVSGSGLPDQQNMFQVDVKENADGSKNQRHVEKTELNHKLIKLSPRGSSSSYSLLIKIAAISFKAVSPIMVIATALNVLKISEKLLAACGVTSLILFGIFSQKSKNSEQQDNEKVPSHSPTIPTLN